MCCSAVCQQRFCGVLDVEIMHQSSFCGLYSFNQCCYGDIHSHWYYENLSCRYGDLEAAEDLIYVGKDINQRDEEQRTPLHYAIAYDNPEVWAELIQAEADLSAVVRKPLLERAWPFQCAAPALAYPHTIRHGTGGAAHVWVCQL